jgi:hypothetical protein
MAEAGPALAVAHDDERREAEALAALHRLGNAIDVDELFDQLLAAIVVAATAATTLVAATAAVGTAAIIAATTATAAARTARTATLGTLRSRFDRSAGGFHRRLAAFVRVGFVSHI